MPRHLPYACTYVPVSVRHGACKTGINTPRSSIVRSARFSSVSATSRNVERWERGRVIRIKLFKSVEPWASADRSLKLEKKKKKKKRADGEDTRRRKVS